MAHAQILYYTTWICRIVTPEVSFWQDMEIEEVKVQKSTNSSLGVGAIQHEAFEVGSDTKMLSK